MDEPKFMVDNNVGKLTKWLRMVGYDALFFDGKDDARMIATAWQEGRVILTRDTQIMRRRVVTSGRLKALLLQSDEPEQQVRQVIATLGLDCRSGLFTRCLECNRPLVTVEKQQVKGRVPPYVFQTQRRYMACPGCARIYWRGTHWAAMKKRLAEFGGG